METTDMLDLVASIAINPGSMLVVVAIVLVFKLYQKKPFGIKFVEAIIWGFLVYPFLFLAAMLWKVQSGSNVPIWQVIVLFVMMAVGCWWVSDYFRKRLDRALNRS